MTKPVLIIGINGVGKEHIRACNNLGIPYVLLDRDTSSFEGKKEVENVWGSHRNRVGLEGLQLLTSSYKEATAISYQAAVVATPNSTHLPIVFALRQFFDAPRIMVEKPSLCRLQDVDWIGYLPLDLSGARGKARFEVEAVERDWSSHPLFNLMGHLFYARLRGIGRKEEISFLDCSANYCRMRLMDGFTLEVSKPEARTRVILDDEREVWADYERLFTEQMQRFLSGESNIDLAGYVESRIVSFSLPQITLREVAPHLWEG